MGIKNLTMVVALCIFATPCDGAEDTKVHKYACFLDRCTIGVQFCETVKQICRPCDDFLDYCWTDNHIGNCTSVCRDNTPFTDQSTPPDENLAKKKINGKNTETKETSVYPWLIPIVTVTIILIIAMFIYLWLRDKKICANFIKSCSPFNIREKNVVMNTKDEEMTVISMESEDHPASEDGNLLGSPDGQRSYTFNQINTTNDRGDTGVLATSGSKADTRDTCICTD